MLKIKDNVDFKELEKYGYLYEEEYDVYGFFNPIYIKHCKYYWCVIVDTLDRKIYKVREDLFTTLKEKDIDDLIKDDLVEKVND